MLHHTTCEVSSDVIRLAENNMSASQSLVNGVHVVTLIGGRYITPTVKY